MPDIWQHMGRVPHPNYVDPECCVASVCHQVHFMYWEHLGHFNRAISHLKWHKIVCMRYLAWNPLTCFPCICNLESPDISYGDLLRVEHRTSLFSCLCMSMLTTNSSDNMQKHGYFGMFSCCIHHGKYIWGLWHSQARYPHVETPT